MAEEKADKPARAGFASRSWLYELPLFFLLLEGLQRYLLPEDPGFRGVHPSPYWLAALLFGFRYGLGAGLASGIGASLLYAWGCERAGEGFLLGDTDFYLRPGLFLLVGAAVGGAADKYAQRIYGLEQKLEDYAGRIRGLQRHIQAEQKVLRAVEQQVVSQMSSIVTLFQGSRELGTLECDELLDAILDFFTSALRAKKTSLYVPREGKWELLGERGWETKDAYPRSVEPGSGVVGRAGAEKRVVSLRDLFLLQGAEGTVPGLRSDAIMAAPILDPSGEAIAVFAVQTMDFMRFNSASVNLLTLLAEWGKESVEKCLHVKELKSRSLIDEELGVHGAKYFESQMEQEFARSVRFALPLSIVVATPIFGDDVPADVRKTQLRVVGRVLREMARKIDVVARMPRDFAPLAVILPTTTKENAQQLMGKIRTALRVLEFPVEVRLGLGSYHPGMRSQEDLLEQARADLG